MAITFLLLALAAAFPFAKTHSVARTQNYVKGSSLNRISLRPSISVPYTRKAITTRRLELRYPENRLHLVQASDAALPASSDAAGLPSESSKNISTRPMTIKGRIINFLTGGGKLDRQKMAALGLGCLLSYGFVSNINVGILTAIAWASFSTQTGLSPLEPGQWPKFVAVQVGLYAVIGNLLRPFRLALAVSISPFFNKFIELVSRAAAIFLNVLLFNFIINISFMVSGIWVASKVSGIPAIPAGHPLDLWAKFSPAIGS
eukprot:jgi/Bigna1/68109/fgenesh1_pg.5_\